MEQKGRDNFRESLLEYKARDYWKEHRPNHLQLYRARFNFEGRELSGQEIIGEYASRFPADRKYSTKANLNRMLEECGIEQFLFSNPDTLRGFLLSAKSPAQWNDYEPSYHSFNDMTFQYIGIALKGQMLLNHVFMELENKANRTYYAFVDYSRNAGLQNKLEKGTTAEFIGKLPVIAGFKPRIKEVDSENLPPDRVREILIAQKSAENWAKWDGSADDFRKMRFRIPEYRVFTGSALLRGYEQTTGKRCTVDDLFKIANVQVASDPSVLRKWKTEHLDKMCGMMDDPVAIRNLFLQLRSEKEWKRPRTFVDTRHERVNIDGKKVTVHDLLHRYSIHKYNSRQTNPDDYVFLKEAQSRSNVIQSNTATLKELLEFGGLEAKFIPDVGDVDLHSPVVLKRLLFNGRLADRKIPVSEAVQMKAEYFRKIRFTDPDTGFSLTGHSLMIYFDALKYTKHHPEVTLNQAAVGMNKGKSNQKVMDELVETAGLRR